MSLLNLLASVRANRAQYLIHPCVLELGALVNGWQLVEPSSRPVVASLRESSGQLSGTGYWQQVLFRAGDTVAAYEQALGELEAQAHPPIASAESVDLFQLLTSEISSGHIAMYLGSRSFARLFAFVNGAIGAQHCLDPELARENSAKLTSFSDFVRRQYKVPAPWHVVLYGLYGDVDAMEWFAREWSNCFTSA